MICPNCGVHDADTGAGVHIRIHGGYDAYEIQDLLLTGVEPFRPEPEGPDCFCTECDYTAETREDYDRDILDSTLTKIMTVEG